MNSDNQARLRAAAPIYVMVNALTSSDKSVTDYRPPPLFGENRREKLSSKLGFDQAKIAALMKQGVIWIS